MRIFLLVIIIISSNTFAQKSTFTYSKDKNSFNSDIGTLIAFETKRTEIDGKYQRAHRLISANFNKGEFTVLDELEHSFYDSGPFISDDQDIVVYGGGKQGKKLKIYSNSEKRVVKQLQLEDRFKNVAFFPEYLVILAGHSQLIYFHIESEEVTFIATPNLPESSNGLNIKVSEECKKLLIDVNTSEGEFGYYLDEHQLEIKKSSCKGSSIHQYSDWTLKFDESEIWQGWIASNKSGTEISIDSYPPGNKLEILESTSEFNRAYIFESGVVFDFSTTTADEYLQKYNWREVSYSHEGIVLFYDLNFDVFKLVNVFTGDIVKELEPFWRSSKQ